MERGFDEDGMCSAGPEEFQQVIQEGESLHEPYRFVRLHCAFPMPGCFRARRQLPTALDAYGFSSLLLMAERRISPSSKNLSLCRYHRRFHIRSRRISIRRFNAAGYLL